MDTLTTIQRLAAERLEVSMETVLRARTFAEAGIDSLTTLDLITSIEASFGITIAPEDLADVRSLRDLATVVDRLVTRKSHALEEALG
ncbi:MAG TPA: acyl carrier protein [Steroidobacteraceae bacterium]|nr:acyl carrier protein [Steroidobacteraceae bacterium]